jgi:ketosteroid isomerase-like protein
MSEENVEIVRASFEAWNTGDMEVVVAPRVYPERAFDMHCSATRRTYVTPLLGR